MEVVQYDKCFGGSVIKCRKNAKSLGGLATQFTIFLPEVVAGVLHNIRVGDVLVVKDFDYKIPSIYYLAGLTCTEDTGPMKSGGLQKANELQVALIFPDTSPRGANIPREDDEWDFGTGAGFYLDATAAPWNQYYKMETYITTELPQWIESYFPIDGTMKSICGHSMGGHGALILGIKNPTQYKSISAFAPICAPTDCPWGTKAFGRYLKNHDEWNNHDAVHLVKSAQKCPPILIDQGTDDQFLTTQLKITKLMEVQNKHDIEIRMQDGYNHSYYFISTFFPEHIEFHKKYLK